MFKLLNSFQNKASINSVKCQLSRRYCQKLAFNNTSHWRQVVCFCILLFTFYFLLFTRVSASRVDELKQKISDQNSQIDQIEKDIEKYKNQIATTLEEANSLKTEIKRLEAIKAKLKSDIALTQKKIQTAGYNIEKLDLEVVDKQLQISKNKESLGEIMRNMSEADSQTVVEITLANRQFSDFFDNVSQMDVLQKNLNEQVDELKDFQKDLELKRDEQKVHKSNLENLKSQLSDQTKLTEQNKKQKDDLLKDTKNKEANYKKILADKVAQKEAFDREVMELEMQLKIAIDPKSIPSVGSGVLAWPLNNVFITQYFGNTPFATKNPQIYNGKGHTGVDFRAAPGELVKAARGGVVSGVGNTDEIRGCYSYGKWVLIKHDNGLSTLYSHLSLMKVYEGQQVEVGQVIGYSGSTGYATGPHLHFAVYATQGVRITKFENSVNCKNAIVPIADIKAYLNPLSYL